MLDAQNSDPVFSGEFARAVDPKNRISVPAKWLQSEADEFYLVVDRTKSCLKAMPPAEFKAVAAKLEANPNVSARDLAIFLRHFYSQARQVNADKQGRMVLPPELCELLNLKGEIMLIGAQRIFEFWNKEAWQSTQVSEADTVNRLADLAGL